VLVRISIILLLGFSLNAQTPGPYAPAVGSAGSRAIHKDSSLIETWASHCRIYRGAADIADSSAGLASFGDSTDALGYANGKVVSLGDGGIAEYYFNPPLYDKNGFDFAVFENSFSDQFLEFAFVEISSDGINWERFPATSLLDTNIQTSAFGSSDPSKVYNLAGKYRQGYGQPFDFAELQNRATLKLDSIYFIRLIDVVGSIDPSWASRDANGRIINDPYPTAFASSGFDLDALALLKANTIGLVAVQREKTKLYPNPAYDRVNIGDAQQAIIYDVHGKRICESERNEINLIGIPPGIYIVKLQTKSGIWQSIKLEIRP
jgi:hypothetical protein